MNVTLFHIKKNKTAIPVNRGKVVTVSTFLVQNVVKNAASHPSEIPRNDKVEGIRVVFFKK